MKDNTINKKDFLQIGEFKVEKIDLEHFKITKQYNEDFYNEVTICGGDLESVLGILFISNNQKSYVHGNVYETTIIKKYNYERD